MSNYPPGAADDRDAPYNQELPQQVEVSVSEILKKETTIDSCSGHWVNEFEYEPDEGRSIATSFYETGNIEEDFHSQCRTAEQCLNDCAKVLKALYAADISFVNHVDIRALYHDCCGWEQEEISIEEV